MNDLSIDTFLKVGSKALTCEDYIISGENPFPYVILSDGCSSSKHTDLGARLLCHSAKFLLEVNPVDYLPRYETIADFTIHNAKPVVDLLRVDPSCLDATLIVSFLHQNSIFVYVYGDGNILTISHKDVVSLYRIHYTGNAPDYLSYRLDDHKREQYKNLQNNQRMAKMYRTTWEQPVEVLNSHDYYQLCFSLDNYKCVMISSDGIESFINMESFAPEPLPTEKVMKELTSFKNPHGEFIKRRLKRMIKEFDSKKIYHFDDLSIGGFHL